MRSKDKWMLTGSKPKAQDLERGVVHLSKKEMKKRRYKTIKNATERGVTKCPLPDANR